MIEIRPLSSGSRKGNCYYVSDGTTPILLDCGLKSWEINRTLDYQLHTIEGVLVSHEHMDHARGALFLSYRGIPVYASQGTLDALDEGKSLLNTTSAFPLYPQVPRTIGTWTVTPFLLKHDAKEPLGFCLDSGSERVVYVTDSPYSRFTFNGMTHILIEANYDLDRLRDNVAKGIVPAAAQHRITWTHFSIQAAIQFLQANDLSMVQEIWLIHLSDNNSHAVDFQRRVAEAVGKVVHIA